MYWDGVAEILDKLFMKQTSYIKFLEKKIDQQEKTIAKYEKLLSSFMNEDYPSEDTEDTQSTKETKEDKTH